MKGAVDLYQMVIADDEFYIRDGLCKMDWSPFDIEVAAVCQNGAEAAKYIYENPVDILLTDIRMPIISGLELIQDVGRRFPEIKTVALTAYDDFEYIRTCLRSGTVDYVLKPFSEESLYKTFSTIKTILDKEKAEQKRVADLERANRMKTLALRREWMGSIFHENMSDERMDEISTYCEILLESPWLFLCIVRLNERSRLSEEDLDLTVFSFRNAMEEFCVDETSCYYIDEETADCCFLRGFAQEPLQDQQRELVEEIWKRLYKLRGVFRCTLSGAACAIDDRHQIAACTAFLSDRLKTGPEDTIQIYSAEKLAILPSERRDESGTEEEVGTGSHTHLVRMVKEYIRENYSKPITLQLAAESVFVSQSYLSHVFKLETGQNFVKYLTEYRIQEACRLLRETNRRVYDIVHMVGYDSPKYFSEVFKRVVGTTPNGYRQQGGRRT